jgi:hypothetical protein
MTALALAIVFLVFALGGLAYSIYRGQSMTDLRDVEISRLQAEIACLRDAIGRATALQREMDAEIRWLRVALRAMLETHGRPHRSEWTNERAFEHAKTVDAQARAALKQEGADHSRDYEGSDGGQVPQ